MSYGRGKSDKSQPVDRLQVQDEHVCIYEALKLLIDVHRKGGIPTTVTIIKKLE